MNLFYWCILLNQMKPHLIHNFLSSTIFISALVPNILENCYQIFTNAEIRARENTSNTSMSNWCRLQWHTFRFDLVCGCRRRREFIGDARKCFVREFGLISPTSASMASNSVKRQLWSNLIGYIRFCWSWIHHERNGRYAWIISACE